MSAQNAKHSHRGSAPASSQPGDAPSAPLLPGTKPPRKKLHHHVVRHVRVVHHHSKAATIAIARGYKHTDRHVVRAVKRSLPETTRVRIQANRAANDGNIRTRFALPFTKRHIPITIPEKAKYARHAVLPAALLVLIIAILPAGAAPIGYGETKIFGGALAEQATAAAAFDDAVYTAGSFEGSVNFAADFGGTDLRSTAGVATSAFITKSTSGSYGWTREFTSDSGSVMVASMYATAEYVYVTGSFTGTVDFGDAWNEDDEKTATSAESGFITKLTSDGDDYEWTYTFGADAIITPSAVTYEDGLIIVAGSFTGDLEFDISAPLRVNETGHDGFIAAIADGATPEYVWDHNLASEGNVRVGALAVHDGLLTAGGWFSAAVDFDNDDETENTITPTQTDGFLLTLSLAGLYDDVRVFGGDGDESVTHLLSHESDALYVAGTFSGESVFGTLDSVDAAGDVDAFAVKVDEAGDYEWVRTFGGSEATVLPAGIAVQADGDAYLAGSFTGAVNFSASFGGSDTRTNYGATSGFVTSFSDGSYIGTYVAGAEEADAEPGAVRYHAVAAGDPDEAIHIVGDFEGSINFGQAFSLTDSKESSLDSRDVLQTSIVKRPHRTITGGGLRYFDQQGVNLATTGTQALSSLVSVLDNDDTYLAQVVVDFDEDRVWTIAGDTDHTEYVAYIAGLPEQSGAADTYTFYVPKRSTDKAVLLCPGAESFVVVTAMCEGASFYADGRGAAVQTIEGTDYWVVENREDTSIGGRSISYPGLVLGLPVGDLEVTEGGSNLQVTVRLPLEPTAAVTVTPDIDPEGQITISAPLVFTTENWATPQTFTITAVNDNFIEVTTGVALGLAVSSEDVVYDGGQEPDLTVQVIDNDAAGIVWSSQSLLTSEASPGASAELCIALTAQPTDDVTLLLASSDTSEITVPSELVIAPEDWDAETNCFAVTVIDDDEVDGAQEVTINVTGTESADDNFNELTTSGWQTVAVTNQDDDEAGFDVTADGSVTTEDEEGDEVTVCVQLMARPTAAVTIPVSVSDTSEASVSGESLVIAPADWDDDDNCIVVTGVDDNLIDGDIEYELVFGDPTSSDPVWHAFTADNITNVQLTNIDDDTAGLHISSHEVSATEGGAPGTFTVSLTSQPAEDKTVVLAVASNNSSQATVSPEALTFTHGNWDAPQTVTVTVVDDTAVEGEHSASLQLSVDDEATTEVAYLSLEGEQVTVLITDNDTATASITAIASAVEGGTNGAFTVNLTSTNQTGAPVAVTYEVHEDSTAVAGQQYVALSGSVAIPHGQSSATITVNVGGMNNALFQGDKVLKLTLTSSSSASVVIGEDDEATVIIADDEVASVTLSASDGDEEGPLDIVFTASLSLANNTGSDLEFVIIDDGGTAVSGADYEAFAGQTIMIIDGETSGALVVTVHDDALLEALSETVIARVQGLNLPVGTQLGETTIAAASIIDNDTASVSVVTAAGAAEPSTAGSFTISLNKTNNTGGPIQVSYDISGSAVSGTDYTALSSTASINSGADSATVTVSPTDDVLMEGDETVILTLTGSNFDRVSLGEPNASTLTISDDEIAGVIVSIVDSTTNEDGGTAEICFALRSQPAAAVTIALQSSDTGKVTVQSDVTIQPEAWDGSTCVTATGQDDIVPTVTGTQTVTIFTGAVESDDPFYVLLTAEDIDDVELEHADNDTPGVLVQVVSDVTSEDGEKTAVIRFRLQTQPTHPVTIALAVSDETEGSLESVNSVTITPTNWNNWLEHEIVVIGVDDALTDGDIAYELQTGSVTSSDTQYAAIGAGAIDDVQLFNEDDDQAAVDVAQTDGTTSVSEDGVTDEHLVSIASQPAEGNSVVIIVSPTNGQLDVGEGAGQPVELTFTHENWQDSQGITIAAVDDDWLEAAHTATISYAIAEATTEQAYVDYTGSIPNQTVAITDNDTATITLSESAGNEAGPVSMTFIGTLSKENQTGNAITFLLNPSGGSAIAGTDYTDFSGVSLSIPSGSTTGQVLVGVIDDSLLEGDESVQATLSTSSLPAVSIVTADTVTIITDNDTAFVSVVATIPTAAENPASNGSFTVQLSRQNSTGSDIIVAYAVSGSASPNSDYAALSGTLTIPDGSSSAQIIVDVADFNDEIVEGNETIIVTLDSVDHHLVSVGAPFIATVTIADDDAFAWHITASQSGSEEGPDNLVFTISLSQLNTTGEPVTVKVEDIDAGTATAGDDYAPFGGLISIPDGEQEATIAVIVIDDELLEGDETVGISLSEPSQGDIGVGIATGIIHDNDQALLSITASEPHAAENPAVSGQFTVTLSKANHGTSPILVYYSVHGTATAGDDYAALPGVANIPVEQSSTIISLDTLGFDDDMVEGSETVIVILTASNQLSVGVGDLSSAVVTITDDDQDLTEAPESKNQAPPNSTYVPAPRAPSQPILVEPAQPLPVPVDQVRDDGDSDGIDDAEEARAYNNGDGNGDGIPDSIQRHVASRVSTVTGKPVTLEARGECQVIKKFVVLGESELEKNDTRYRYPNGLVDYEIACNQPGQSTTVSIYYDTTLSGQWRKFASVNMKFAKLEAATVSQKTIGNAVVTVVSYGLTDGDSNDDDGKQDGKILDPAGFAQRTLYAGDAFWVLIPILIAAAFVVRAIRHHRRDHQARKISVQIRD